VGRSLVGSRAGDSFDITIEGRERYWTIESVG
jgi:transcription elongation GreA/GreB family factor